MLTRYDYGNVAVWINEVCDALRLLQMIEQII